MLLLLVQGVVGMEGVGVESGRGVVGVGCRGDVRFASRRGEGENAAVEVVIGVFYGQGGGELGSPVAAEGDEAKQAKERDGQDDGDGYPG